jgi:Zn-dependent M28 family amino/carboxypeptidase
VLLMLNLDMVGRLRTGGLTFDVSAAGAARRALRPLLDSAAAAAGLRPRYSSAIAERSDHASFGRAGIPAVALFTGFHADYHRATDVASRVDARGIERVVDVVEAVVRAPGGGLANGSRWH